MNCPICDDVRMREVQKDGVMIDVCPNCKGVWLDRGELEKLMSEVRDERKAYHDWYDEQNNRPSQTGYSQRPNEYKEYPPYPPYYKHKKKKSVLDRLGDLFD